MDLLPKSERPTFGTRLKVKKMEFLDLKTFDLVKIFNKSFDLLPKMRLNNKTFDLLPTNNFDLLPKLTETFNLVVWSWSIWSSDQIPLQLQFLLFFQSVSGTDYWMDMIVATEAGKKFNCKDTIAAAPRHCFVIKAFPFCAYRFPREFNCMPLD